jgi:hypothetical protein
MTSASILTSMPLISTGKEGLLPVTDFEVICDRGTSTFNRLFVERLGERMGVWVRRLGAKAIGAWLPGVPLVGFSLSSFLSV